jgi:YD repeat-containing protein
LFARKLIETGRRELGSKRWRLEIRTTCPIEFNHGVFVEGRAIVRDSEDRVRFFGESVGSGDSAGTWRFYYDGLSRLRAVVFAWQSYTGAKANGVAAFDATGRLQSCRSLPGDSGGIFCPYVEPEVLDSDVEGVVKPEVRERIADDRRAESPIVWAFRMDPVAEFSKCEEQYRPKR